jgi:serine/threonine-protein phosphatase 2A regulatory subunit A
MVSDVLAIISCPTFGQWRVRAAVIEFMPALAEQLGVRFFDDKVGTLSVPTFGFDL